MLPSTLKGVNEETATSYNNPKLVVVLNRVPLYINATNVKTEKYSSSSDSDSDSYEEEFGIEESQTVVNFYIKLKKNIKKELPGDVNQNGNTEREKKSLHMKYNLDHTIKYEEIDIKSDNEGGDSQVKPVSKPQNNLQNILFMTHQKRNIFICYNCSFETGNKSVLRHHIKKTHLGPEKATTYHCSYCPYWSYFKHNCAIHEMTHKPKEERPQIKCPHCSFIASNTTSIKQHLNKHTKTKIYKCPICPYTTSWKANLTHQHSFSHQCEMFKCSVCDFETKYKYGLKTHELIHDRNNNLWLQCPKCPYKTYRKGHFKIHEMRHDSTKGRWYKCPECPYKALMKKHLTTHLLRHVPEDQIKWFQCPMCSYKSNSERTLNSHLLIHKSDEEIDWFYCFNCKFKTKRKNSLRYHMKTHQKTKEEKV
ncbi:zinc finger protein 64-like isoform X1 [Euwallacea fornicatus]|uniref:zinc finger protein 64-like isoform X1 n=1 Tax=Euwallacea fornicatus TaxID=995702 RepID=UPI00338D6CF5